MHRSPLCMLVLGAALAACSTRDDPRSGEILSKDSTLVARLDVDLDTHHSPLPDACRTLAVAAPAVVNKPQADTLARRASDAEILGNVQEARTLLRRAFELDGTNKTTAYHLGRTSEALGDRGEAVTAYCRYLALNPTPNESAEARQRVVSLSQKETRAVAAGAGDSVANGASTRLAETRAGTGRAATRAAVRNAVTTERVATTQRVATEPTITRRARSEQPAANRRVATNTGVSDGAGKTADAGTATTTVEQVGGPVDSASAGGEVLAASTPEPTVDRPASDSRASRGPGRAQSAGIGAAAGAILGAATGRSVKGAVIGAAAGGILGSVMGGR